MSPRQEGGECSKMSIKAFRWQSAGNFENSRGKADHVIARVFGSVSSCLPNGGRIPSASGAKTVAIWGISCLRRAVLSRAVSVSCCGLAARNVRAWVIRWYRSICWYRSSCSGESPSVSRTPISSLAAAGGVAKLPEVQDTSKRRQKTACFILLFRSIYSWPLRKPELQFLLPGATIRKLVGRGAAAGGSGVALQKASGRAAPVSMASRSASAASASCHQSAMASLASPNRERIEGGTPNLFHQSRLVRSVFQSRM